MDKKPILDKQSKDYLEFCYKEYTRLAGIQEKHLQSAFSDVRLLGAVGAILAWKPILNALSERNDPVILTLGFLVLIFIALFVLLYDCMKQSIMLFYADQMKYYERELRQGLDVSQGTMFSNIHNWTHWMSSIHDPIVKCFFGCFFSFLLLFPVSIIALSGTWSETYKYIALYLVIAFSLSFMNILCINIITKKITEKLSSSQ